MLPLGQLISRFNCVCYHCYADDTQLYISFKPHQVDRLTILYDCFTAIKEWMANNFLQLNCEKTEVLLIGLETITPPILFGSLPIKSCCRNLEIILFDQHLNFEQHVKSLSRNCFYQLRNISKLRSFVPYSVSETIIHAFISSRLDYCN
ncbi:hypothetical protein LDENG_00171160 [Lucifuga dentata]|nr:hypothetical protein LDENG_00171160 [Lucifuga dentata]